MLAVRVTQTEREEEEEEEGGEILRASEDRRDIFSLSES